MRVGSRGWEFAGGAKQEKTGEIFGIVLDAGSKDEAAVVFGGAAGGDARAGFVTESDGFAHASGGVFGGNALEVRMHDEKSFALS